MYQKIGDFFHVNTWWGKVVFITLFYFVYWFLFYGVWVFLPRGWFLEKIVESGDLGYVLAFFLFILLPILSFIIPFIIKKTFRINKAFLYSLHVFLILLSIYIFIVLGVMRAFSNIQIG